MRKRMISLALSLLLAVTSAIAPFGAFAASSYENATTLSDVSMSDWMSAIRGETRLTEITIPGTHDSCARKFANEDVFGILSGISKCQSLNITEQLDAGIRWLDVRCEVDASTYSVKTVHGSTDCWNGNDYYYLDYVFQDVYNWLDAHPSETVLICIKEDDGDNGVPAFTNAIYEYIHGYGQGKYFYGESYNYNDYWYLGKSVPTLDEVRGKCVLFNRFDQYIGNESSQGVVVDEAESGQKIKYNDFSDTNYTEPVYVNVYSNNTGIGTAHIQDYYKWNTESKIKATQYMLSLGHYRGEYYINYSSTVSDSTAPNPQNLSKTVNAAYPTFTYTKNKPSGIFAMDFATADLARYIVLNNEAVSNIVTGTDGNINYTLNRLTGTLTVSGNGAMNNYAYTSANGVNGMGSTAPWGDQAKNAVFDGQYNTDIIKSIVVEEGVTSIGSYAFYGYDNVTSVSIPSTVTSIGEGAFTKCASLESVDISNTAVSSIGASAFKDCTGLKQFYTVSSLTDIADNAFTNSTNFTMYGEQGIPSQTYANARSIPYVATDTYSYSVNVKAGNTVKEASNPFAGKDLSNGVTISFKQNAKVDRGWNNSLITFSSGRNYDNRYFIIMSNGTILFNDGNGGAGGWNNCYFDINSSDEVNTVGSGWVDIDIVIYPDKNGNHILDYYINKSLAKTYNLNLICASGYPNGVSGSNGIFSFLSAGDINLYYGSSFSIYDSMAGTADSYLDDVYFYSFANAPTAVSDSAVYFNDFNSSLGGNAVTGSPDNGKVITHDTSNNDGRTGSVSFPWGNNGGSAANYIATSVSPFEDADTSNGLTVSFWQRINGNYWDNKQSITFAQGDTGECKYFTIGTDGYIRFNNGNGGSDSSLSNAGLYFDYTTPNSDIVKQQWQFVTVDIIDDYNFKVYVNGRLSQTVNVTGTSQYQSTGGLMSFLASGNTKLYFGSFTPYWGTCSLSLDDVYCFEGSLSPSQIDALYRYEVSNLNADYSQSFDSSIPQIKSGSASWLNGFEDKNGVLYIPSASCYNDVTLYVDGQSVNGSSAVAAGSEVRAEYNGSYAVDTWYTVNPDTNTVTDYQQGGSYYSFTIGENSYIYLTLTDTDAPDYSAYDSAVLYASSFDGDDYSAESFENLTDTLSSYSEIKSSNPTQVQVDTATFDILTAVSDLVPYLTLEVSTNDGTVAVTVNGSAINENSASVLFGDEISVSAQSDSSAFLGWLELDTKRFFSTDTQYSFVITSNTRLKAMFTSNDCATLTLTDDSGWVCDTITMPCTDWISVASLSDILPEVPYSYGASSGYWSYNENDVLSLLTSGNNVTISAVYERAIDASKLPERPYAAADVPVINLAFDNDTQNDIGVFIMAYDVPENCTVYSKGMAVSYGKPDKFSPSDIELTVNNKMRTSKFDTNEDIYILDIEHFSGFNWAVRGYVTYYDTNGNLKTAYSNQINITN